jgi:lipopolysaccharide/colanic/teichoic acid biosynthesis glycosyltransferase
MPRDSRRPRSSKPFGRFPANEPRTSLGRGSANLGLDLPTKRSPSPSWLRQERFLEGLTRFGDLVIACALLVFTFPLIIAIAVAIRCEGSGPILVWQHRIGSDGQLFNGLRFRTSPASPAGTEWFRRAQRTRVGEVLWRAHLDGLPMVINVLRGEMTILGTGKRARLLG